MTRLDKERDLAISAALRAGDILRQDQRKPGGPRGEHDKAPADVESEVAIHELLCKAFPDDGFIGEEDPALNRPAQDDRARIWLVDPNDGTRAYLKGWRGNTVSIGLIEKGRPVLGVVYAPCWPDDEGTLYVWADGMAGVERNGELQPRLQDAPLCKSDVLALSQAADLRPQVHAGLADPARYQPIPSIAFRLALAACGDYAAAVSLHHPDNYDVLAGHALLIGAGADLFNESGEAWSYAIDGSVRTGGLCFGGRPTVCKALRERDWSPARSTPIRKHGEFDPRALRPGLGVSDPTLLDRARGCLLGLLCGDALGTPVEGKSAADLLKRWPEGLREMIADTRAGMLPGQLSDDGELALMLARSLIRCEAFEPAHTLRAYASWYRSESPFIGATTKHALSFASAQLGADSRWPDAIARAPQSVIDATCAQADHASTSNGALMRIAPLALFALEHDAVTLRDWCRQDASLTHPHPVCTDAGALLCLAIQAALTRDADSETSALLDRVEAQARSLELDPRVIETLALARSGATSPDRDGSHDDALLALHNALAQLLRAPDAREGIVASVMLGGDTDTNAAIAGALLGAWHGVSSLPEAWTQHVITTRAIAGHPGVGCVRPVDCWAVDAFFLPELLIELGARSTQGDQHA